MCNARRPTSLCVMSYLRAAIAEHIIPLCGAYPSLVPSRSVEGPLNAAAASALGMHLFRPRAVVNFGIAGAHNPELKKGDLVIGKDAVDHSGLKSSSARESEGSIARAGSLDPHIRRR
jgi:nucleoside phosphorylase